MFAPLLTWFAEHFQHPWVLFFLPLALLPWIHYLAPGRRPALAFSSIAPLRDAGATWAVRLRVLVPLLRTLALALLIGCCARPRQPNQLTRVDAEGIAIQLVVDRSGSMEAMDFSLGGRRVDRLSAVKRVVQDFVNGDDTLEGRPNDLVGAIVFARFADSRCPLTLNHDFLVKTLEETPIVSREEDGTAIGDGLSLGVERLRALEHVSGARLTSPVRSRIIILLTDGENNAGDIEPDKAAEMAAAFGIKVYTIGAGTRGMAPYPVTDPFSGQRVLRNMPVRIDENQLRRIADATGGRYFRATDTESLQKIYAEIDRLEKTRTEERRYMEYKEFATQWVSLGRWSCPPLLACVFALLIAERLAAETRLRTLP